MKVIFSRFPDFQEMCRHRDGYTCYHKDNFGKLRQASKKSEHEDSGRKCHSLICPLILLPLRGEKRVAYAKISLTVFDDNKTKKEYIKTLIKKQIKEMKL